MRKGQIQLLKRAEKKGLPVAQTSFLSRDDIPLKELKAAFWYFNRQNVVYGEEKCLQEAWKMLGLYRQCRRALSVYERELLLQILLPFWTDDTLFGSQAKRRFPKMLGFLKGHLQGYGGYPIHFLLSYAELLYKGYSSWHINTLLRYMIKENDTEIVSYMESFYPTLIDDFLKNRKNSLFYYVAVERNILSDFREFRPKPSVLERLYDWDKHCFSFNKKDFDIYFIKDDDKGLYVENRDAIIQEELKRHPVIPFISEFCKQNGYLTRTGNDDVCIDYALEWIDYNGEFLEKLKACQEILDKQFSVEIKNLKITVNVSLNCFITVTITKYKCIHVGKEKGAGELNWHGSNRIYKTDFMISPDGLLYKRLERSKKLKYYPMSVRQFMNLLNAPDEPCRKLAGMILKYHIDKNIFYKDIISDCAQTQALIPVSFNEIADYHNRKELVTKKWKKAAGIPAKWNTMNINLSYMIVKAYPYVKKGAGRAFLLQQRNLELLDVNEFNTVSQKIISFLENILTSVIADKKEKMLQKQKKLYQKQRTKYIRDLEQEILTPILPEEYDEYIRATARDYINICMHRKEAIILNVSYAQLKNLHDHVARDKSYYLKRTRSVNVPENSRFNALREILPKEFEWIRTRERLILEAELQHHCVWSYASDISSDTCAIYSFTDTNATYTHDGVARRYTVEFQQNKDGKYFVVQTQGRYDSVNARGMKEYIQQILDSYQG